MAEAEKPKEFRQEHREFMGKLSAELNTLENARVSGTDDDSVNLVELLAKLDQMAASYLNPEILNMERPRGSIEKEKWQGIILRAILQILQELLAQVGGSSASARPSAEPTSPTGRS